MLKKEETVKLKSIASHREGEGYNIVKGNSGINITACPIHMHDLYGKNNIFAAKTARFGDPVYHSTLSARSDENKGYLADALKYVANDVGKLRNDAAIKAHSLQNINSIEADREKGIVDKFDSANIVKQSADALNKTYEQGKIDRDNTAAHMSAALNSSPMTTQADLEAAKAQGVAEYKAQLEAEKAQAEAKATEAEPTAEAKAKNKVPNVQ